MQPTRTIDTTDTLGTENAPENLKDIAKSAIMDHEDMLFLMALRNENYRSEILKLLYGG